MKLALHWQILIALALGIVLGLTLNRVWTPSVWQGLGVGDAAAFLADKSAEANAGAGLAARAVRWLIEANQFVADLFVRCLRFVAVPIVLFSLIAGTASLGNISTLGRIGIKTLAMFIFTTVVAIVIGLGLANFFGPGRQIDEATRAMLSAGQEAAAAGRIADVAKVQTMWQQFLEMMPRNPFEALAKGDMLQTIVFAMVVGAGLTMIPAEKARPVAALFDALTDVMIKVVGGIMRLAPLAVVCLITPVLARMGLDVLKALAGYCVMFTFGIALVLYVEYPILLRVLARQPVLAFYRGLAPAKLMALSTSSSNATLPVTIACCRSMGVSERVAAFVLPLGATINMNGTAMYLAVASLFIAQLYGIDLTLGQQASIVITATLAAIGTPGIPSASIVFLVVILEGLGVPPQGIAVILGVDAILDRVRTVANIAGDAVTAVIVAKSEGELGNAK